MENEINQLLETLKKTLEAGTTNAAPASLVQGAATQKMTLDDVMYNVSASDEHLNLRKTIETKTFKNTTYTFTRKLSTGILGGAAQFEGDIGEENTSEIVRAMVPMAYYSELRRNTIVANEVDTFDGKGNDTRAAEDAALHLAMNIEFECYGALDNFSNAGVFDGNPLAIPELPNMHGAALQIRQSDSQLKARDQIFAEYGNDDSVVLSPSGAGFTIAQEDLENLATRTTENYSKADVLRTSPRALANYNKLGFNKERIVLAGGPQGNTGSNLKRQYTSNQAIDMQSSIFLRGKVKPRAARSTGPSAPASVTPAAAVGVGATIPTGAYWYFATAVNTKGESAQTNAAATTTVAALGNGVNVSIAHPGSGTVTHFNVYRSAAGGSLASAAYIGSVKAAASSPTVFVDLGNRVPRFSTAYLMDSKSMHMAQMAPFTSLDLALSDLSTPKAYYVFETLAVTEPRKNALLDNIQDSAF